MQKKRQSGPSNANVSVICGEHETESSSVDSEDCEEPSLVETDTNVQILTLSGCIVQGSIVQRDAAKSGSNAQNATSGAMKSNQIQTTGTRFFAFSATLNKCSARLP